MDLQTRKIEFVQAFLKLQSEQAILRLEELLRSESQDFKPLSLDEFNTRIDQSMEDSKNGKIIESSQLKAKIAKWH